MAIKTATEFATLLADPGKRNLDREIIEDLIDTVFGTSDAKVEINDQTGTTYQLQLSDVGKYVRCNNASAITVTVPSNIFTAGDRIIIRQVGAGQVTLSSAGTINTSETLLLRTQGSTVELLCTDANTFDLTGDMELA